MKQFGWRSLTYIGFVCGACIVAVSFTAAGGHRVAISMDFYAASAQVIPVLLLAIIVRISSTRALLVASEKEIESQRLELLEKLSRLRKRLGPDTEGEEVRTQIDALETEINNTIMMRKEGRRTGAAPARMSESLTANLIATLILGASGIGTALAALALDSTSGALFIATALAVTWVLIGLVIEEILHFFLTGFFALD